VEEVKLRLLEDAEVRSWLSSAWDALERALRSDLVSPTSRIRQTFAEAIRSLGQNLLVDPRMRGRLNRMIEALATKVIPWRDKLGQFIIEVVR
jgi:uncharacterized membrane-anchored protein YjiN (DUF445 family)